MELGWRSCWHCSLSHCRRHRWRTRTFYQHHWRGEKRRGVEWRKQLEGSGRTSLLERKHGVGKGLKVEVGGRTSERDRRNEGGRRAEGKCRSGAVVVVVFVGLVEDLAVAASGEVIAALDPKLTKSASPDPPSAATAAVAGDGETLPDGNGSKSQTCGKCELDTERATLPCA